MVPSAGTRRWRGPAVTSLAMPFVVLAAAAATVLVPATPAQATPQQLCGLHSVTVPENTTGVVTTTYLTAGRSLQISGSGSIWAGYWLTGTNGPEGWDRTGGTGYPAPTARAFSLLARVGASGPWTYIGRSGTVTNAGAQTQPVQLRTNDNVPGNGSGAFTASYQTCDLSTAPVSQYRLASVTVKHSAKCLDVYFDSPYDAATVQQLTCSSALGERWTLRPTSEGYYEIVSAVSGKCLDVAGYGTDNGTDVQQWTCLDGANQQWSLVQVAPQWYEVVGRQSGRCLDVPGLSQSDYQPLFIWDCWGGENQQWRFSAATP